MLQDKQQQPKKKNMTEPAPNQTGSAPLPAKAKTPSNALKEKAPTQSAAPALRKKVSFPDNLTRGRGTSYSPPNDKVVRFSHSLLHGKEPSHSEGNTKRDPPGASSDANRTTQIQEDDSNVRQSALDKQINHMAKVTKDTAAEQATATESDVDLESDDSFTDLVSPIEVSETLEAGPRPHRCGLDPVRLRHPTHQFGHRDNPIGPTTSKRSSGSTQVQASGSGGGSRSDLADGEPSSEGFEFSSRKHNNIPERHVGFDELEPSKRLGTATAPTYNHRGHRLRSNPTHASILRHSLRRSWPEPLFIFKDTTATTPRPDRPMPTFALRERSESQNNIRASGKSRVNAKSMQE
ncbi:MAG: hypothetical protein Q9169_002038 [Polycauliona sp. 2 TL-2023]